MAGRGLRVAGAALLWTLATAASATPAELTAAWGGWSRPGRTTEIRVALEAVEPARGTITLRAGPQAYVAPFDLGSGGRLRIAVPLRATTDLSGTVELDGGGAAPRPIAVAFAESPLLAVVTGAGQAPAFAPFHVVATDPTTLPTHADAYSAIDALVVDGESLLALTREQLAALLGHVAQCGRVALVAPGDQWNLVRGAAGCAGRTLVSGPDLATALAALQDSLAEIPGSPPSATELRALGEHDSSQWSRVVALLAVALALVVLGAWFVPPRWTALLPVGVAAAVAVALQVWPDSSSLLVWAETEPAARVAQYHAWHWQRGWRRGGVDLEVLDGLSHPRPCDATREVRIELSPDDGRPVAAHFESRLFDVAALCYAGTFPAMRALTVTPTTNARVAVRNAGSQASPAGVFIAAARAQPLASLAPGQQVELDPATGVAPSGKATQIAARRTPGDGFGLLWALRLDTIAAAPSAASAWLFMPVEASP
jgi:hypothetical protein